MYIVKNKFVCVITMCPADLPVEDKLLLNEEYGPSGWMEYRPKFQDSENRRIFARAILQTANRIQCDTIVILKTNRLPEVRKILIDHIKERQKYIKREFKEGRPIPKLPEFKVLLVNNDGRTAPYMEEKLKKVA